MKLTSLFIAAASAAPAKFETENFITSPDVEWVLSLDNVMGGGSTGAFEQLDDHIHFTGQLDLVNGGFAGFVGKIGNKLSGSEVVRVSGRTPTPERTFKVGVSRDNDGTWYHPLTLGAEYQSFEVKLDDFYFSYHGRPNPEIPPPFGSQIRKVRINLSDGKPEPFEADINIIQGL